MLAGGWLTYLVFIGIVIAIAKYRDNLVRLVIDVPDTLKNRNWMKAFKQRWKTKFDQLELWMV